MLSSPHHSGELEERLNVLISNDDILNYYCCLGSVCVTKPQELLAAVSAPENTDEASMYPDHILH